LYIFILFIHRRASGALHVDCSYEHIWRLKIYFTARCYMFRIYRCRLSVHVCLHFKYWIVKR